MVSGVLALKASANGFRLRPRTPLDGARRGVCGHGGQSVGHYYNPAGITQLEATSSGRPLWNLSRLQLQPPVGKQNSGKTYHNSDNLAAVPQIFYTYTPENSPVSFGLGVYAPYGGKSSWPQDTGFRAVALDGSLTYLTINPVVAVKLPFQFINWRRA